MRAAYKPDELTPVHFDEATKIVEAGLASLMGQKPSLKVLALVLAKVTLESGRQGMTLLTSCHHGNAGNIKAGVDYEGMYTLYPCNEVLTEGVVWFRPEGRLDKKGGVVVKERYELPPAGDGHPQCRFRAYANVVDGIYQYLDFIWREKYKDARDALITGDPLAYVHALRLLHYFTADETVYGRGVQRIHAEFMARLEKRPAPVIEVPSLEGLIRAQPFNLRAATALADANLVEHGRDLTEQNFRDDFAADDDEKTDPLPKGKPIA